MFRHFTDRTQVICDCGPAASCEHHIPAMAKVLVRVWWYFIAKNRRFTPPTHIQTHTNTPIHTHNVTHTHTHSCTLSLPLFLLVWHVCIFYTSTWHADGYCLPFQIWMKVFVLFCSLYPQHTLIPSRLEMPFQFRCWFVRVSRSLTICNLFLALSLSDTFVYEIQVRGMCIDTVFQFKFG